MIVYVVYEEMNAGVYGVYREREDAEIGAQEVADLFNISLDEVYIEERELL